MIISINEMSEIPNLPADPKPDRTGDFRWKTIAGRTASNRPRACRRDRDQFHDSQQSL